MECKVCDKVVVDGANYCPYCGTALDGTQAAIRSITFAHLEFRPSGILSSPKTGGELSAALRNAGKICKRYGATVENENRNAITIAFRDNPIGQLSAELAAAAALEIKDYHSKQTALAREKTRLSVSIGIDCAGTGTAETAAGISAETPPVENARRLSAKAPANAVLISGDVAGQIEQAFVAKPLGFYKLRTHSVPQRLFELVDAKLSEPAVFDGTFGKTVFGRNDEKNRLNLFLSEAKNAQPPSLAIIYGDSGSGKTELLKHTAANALNDGWRVVFAHGQEVTRFAPYYIWRGVCRKLLSTYEGLIIADEYALSAIDGDKGEYAAAFFTLQETCSTIDEYLLDVMGCCVSDVPTLIAIDDLDMADYASLRFLNNLLEAVLVPAFAIIATSRKRIGSVRRTQREVELGELKDDAAVGVIKQFVEKTGVDRTTVANLYERCGGNLLILEWLTRHSVFKPGEIHGTVPVYPPFSIPELTEDRIESLDTGNLDLLEFLYNVGEPVPIPDLGPVLGDFPDTDNGRFNDRIRWLTELNLATVYSDSFGEYLGLRGYCRDSLNAREIDHDPSRADRVIRFLEEDKNGNDVLIGHCLLRYGEQGGALERFINAGERARSLGDELDAQSLFSVAVVIAESDGFDGPSEKALSAYVKRADVLRELGLAVSLLTDLRTAVERYGEYVYPRLRLDFAEALANSGMFDESLINALKAVETLEADEEPELRLKGFGLTGDIYFKTGRLTETVNAFGKALRLEPTAEKKSALLLKTGLAKTMDCRINDGEIDFRESLEASQDNWAAGISLAVLLADKGRFLEAYSAAVTALSKTTEAYARGFRPGEIEELSIALLLLSPLVFSTDVTEKVSYVIGRADIEEFKVASDYVSAVRAYISGDSDEFDEALAKIETSGDGLFGGVISGAKSLLSADFNLHYNRDFSSADFKAKNALKAFEKVNFPYYAAECRLLLAETATARGDLLTARNELDNITIRKKRRVSYPYLADYNRVFGELLSLEGETDKSLRFINSAAVLYKSHGMVFQEALCYLALANSAGSDKAAEYYSKAAWLFENSGAGCWVGKRGATKPEKNLREGTRGLTRTTVVQPNP
ncbi:MAG: AAA family ATPase [Candidatus Coatesbacteria bacterium]|nr:MAG: AAA family ATPase [Candidatus Coatesbacteria bacterium]